MTRREVLLLTREPAPRGLLLAAAARIGLEPLILPALRFAEGRDSARLAERLRRGAWDWIAITSARAAEALAEAIAGGAALPPGARIAVVGAATAAPLRAAGVAPALVAPAPSAAALADALVHEGRARSVLFLCGDRARAELPQALATAGVPVESLEVYASEAAPIDIGRLAAVLGDSRLAASVVSSPSAAMVFLDRLTPPDRAHWLDTPCVASGATTADALRELGATRVIVAADPSERGLADALDAMVQSLAEKSPHRPRRPV